MAQLSFYSAEANTPCAGDLAGLVCCQGQLAGFARTAARLSVVVDEAWRARAVRAALSERGIDAIYTTAEDGRLLVRTAFRADLVALATAWTAPAGGGVPGAVNGRGGLNGTANGGVNGHGLNGAAAAPNGAVNDGAAGTASGAGVRKVVPSGLTLDGAALRLWVFAAGDWLEGSYRLGLDPDASQTHEALGGAVARCGLPATLHSVGDEGPGLRISGRRRLGRLAELVGRPPLAAAESHWPAISRVRVSA